MLQRALFLLLLAATPAFGAQGAVLATVDADIDGDGLADHFQLIEGDGEATLTIAMGSGRNIVAGGIVWSGGSGQQPELAVTPRGSVQVISMNESIGRDRWHQTLTLAFRRGDVRVAGYTWNQYDTLDPNAWSTCDLNLLTGRGVREDAHGKRDVKASLAALAVTQWTQEIELPGECD